MTIAFVSDSIFPYNKGGKEKRLYEISTRLAARGHDVHIYCMKWWDGPEQQRIEDGVSLHAICKLYPLYNGTVRSIKEGVLFGLACFKMMRVKADVIDVDSMPFFPVYSVWIVRLIQRKKLYGTWHEALSRKDWTDYMGRLGYIAWVVEHISIKLPYAISSASAHTAAFLKKYHKREKRVSLVTPGVDIEFFNNLQPSPTSYDVISICRLVKDKNIDVLIEAISLVKKTKSNISCLIVGKGPERDAIAQLISQSGLDENVILMPFVENSADLYAYLKSARVFALPSIREGFCMVALESLACSTPVITTTADTNAAKDLVQDGQNGSLVPLAPENFAESIKYWLNENNKTNKSDNIATYDWETIINNQLKVYSS